MAIPKSLTFTVEMEERVTQAFLKWKRPEWELFETIDDKTGWLCVTSLTDTEDPRIFLVVDSDGPDSVDGFGFEEV